MCLLAPRRGKIKQAVARELGGSPVRLREHYTVIVSSVSGWDVVLDLDTPAGPPSVFFGSPPATRIGIPFRPLDDFTLAVRRRGLVGQAIYDRRRRRRPETAAADEAAFREIQHRLSRPDYALGHGEFDYEFSIETSDEQKLRSLFADPGLRRGLQEQRSVRLRMVREDEWLSLLGDSHVLDPTEDALLYFEEPALIKDTTRLLELHRLLVAFAERLVAIGSASPNRPSALKSGPGAGKDHPGGR